MNKLETGRQIFAQIKAHLQKSGHSLTKGNFPPDFPISRASCYNIRNGKFSIELIRKLPFLNIKIEF
jgi:hypothetical protein